MSVEARRHGYASRVDSFDDVFEVFDDVFEVPAPHRSTPPQRHDRQPIRAQRSPARQPRQAREHSRARAHRDRGAVGRRQARPQSRARVRRRRETPTLPLPRAAFMILVVVLVVAGLVGVLVLRTKINENSFRLGDLRQSQQALSLQEQQLEQQLADLSSPGNLLAAAARLGLVQAGTPAYLNLPDGRVVGVPQPATGSDDATQADQQTTVDTTTNTTTEPTGR